MTIRWTQPANDDFPGIVERIVTHISNAAAPVGRRMLAAVEQIIESFFQGNPGRSPEARELVVSRRLYLVIYGIEADDPRSVIHSATAARSHVVAFGVM